MKMPRAVAQVRGPQQCPADFINMRILQNMISGISLILGLGTSKRDPYSCVAFWAPASASLRPSRAPARLGSASELAQGAALCRTNVELEMGPFRDLADFRTLLTIKL